ncbi:MAG: molybdopterin-synthase adenylyltransferase MoeB [Glaciecola sp.]
MKNKTISTSQALRYNRQISLSGFDVDKQELLMNKSALIIGMGGLGCAASQYLVAAGIGRITIVDDDIVDRSNLQRQILHFENNIGDVKVDSAKQTLSQINSDVAIATINTRLDSQALNEQTIHHDIVLDCCDNLTTRNTINAACVQAKTPLVSGSAIRMEGQIFCVVPALNSACYQCISRYFGEQNLSCVESGVMSPVVGIIGATQAIEAIKLLCNYGEAMVNTLKVYDAISSQWHSLNVNKLDDCPTCS